VEGDGGQGKSVCTSIQVNTSPLQVLASKKLGSYHFIAYREEQFGLSKVYTVHEAEAFTLNQHHITSHIST
jgi:hypothetical protein